MVRLLIGFLCVCISYAQVSARNEKVIEAKQSVVTIHAIQENKQVWNPFSDPVFSMFFGRSFSDTRTFHTLSSGSGTVIEYKKKRYILTCYHVIKNAKTVQITFSNGSRKNANIHKVSPGQDLALLTFNEKKNEDIKPLALGDMSKIYETQPVYAIGNGGGIGLSTVSGILAALQVYGDQLYFYITAGINPGNSGGALIDEEGCLIGVPNAIIIKPNVIGYCIPIAQVIKFLEGSTVSLGFDVDQIDTDSYCGLRIKSFDPGCSFNEKLKEGDLILKINGFAIRSVAEFLFFDETASNEKETTVEVLRDGKVIKVSAVAKFRKKTDETLAGILEGMKVSQKRKQVVVENPGSGPWSDQLEKGDIILEVNHIKVTSPTDIKKALKQSHNPLSLVFQRGNSILSFSIQTSHGVVDRSHYHFEKEHLSSQKKAQPSEVFF